MDPFFAADEGSATDDLQRTASHPSTTLKTTPPTPWRPTAAREGTPPSWTPGTPPSPMPVPRRRKKRWWTRRSPRTPTAHGPRLTSPGTPRLLPDFGLGRDDDGPPYRRDGQGGGCPPPRVAQNLCVTTAYRPVRELLKKERLKEMVRRKTEVEQKTAAAAEDSDKSESKKVSSDNKENNSEKVDSSDRKEGSSESKEDSSETKDEGDKEAFIDLRPLTMGDLRQAKNQTLQELREDMNDNDMLKFILKAWVHLLMYASIRGSTEAHAKQLSEGGGLTTLVWIISEHEEER
ncbi:hypothetical protein ZWY2020_022050 [Hordeum vulgare]|nr:hypothetical protein ZWY2020_022050 [Hordeum vulgare]